MIRRVRFPVGVLRTQSDMCEGKEIEESRMPIYVRSEGFLRKGSLRGNGLYSDPSLKILGQPLRRGSTNDIEDSN